MRAVQLNVVEGGISRLRVKGQASEKTLYDALNCFVTADKTVRRRPGTSRVASLPSTTRGLCSFQGKLHTFSANSADQAFSTSLVNVNIITHPTDELELADVHFAQPFLGSLYVVAEFSNGDVFHYWLQEPDATVWSAETVYRRGAVVRPTERNGFAYRGRSTIDPPPRWTPDTPRQVGDLVVPTEPNGFYYEVTDVFGDNPRSGPTEPDWPTNDGQTVNEDSEADPSAPPPGADGDGGAEFEDFTGLPDDLEERYRFGLP